MKLNLLLSVLFVAASSVANAGPYSAGGPNCVDGSYKANAQPTDVASAYRAANAFYAKCINDVESRISRLRGPEHNQERNGLARANRKFVDNQRVANLLRSNNVTSINQISEIVAKTQAEVAEYDRRDAEITNHMAELRQKIERATAEKAGELLDQLQVEYDLLKDEREQDTRSEHYHDLRTNLVVLRWITQNKQIMVKNYLNDEVQFTLSMN